MSPAASTTRPVLLWLSHIISPLSVLSPVNCCEELDTAFAIFHYDFTAMVNDGAAEKFQPLHYIRDNSCRQIIQCLGAAEGHQLVSGQ